MILYAYDMHMICIWYACDIIRSWVSRCLQGRKFLQVVYGFVARAARMFPVQASVWENRSAFKAHETVAP